MLFIYGDNLSVVRESIADGADAGFSVKGGENLHREMVSDLRGVMEREKSPLAVLITLRAPTYYQ
jgi:hypothetical protein